ncbi:hypothetical protein WA158_000623 [Blastocystis sp. Blastoise]
MVKEKVEFDGSKMVDIQKDVIHFERLIGDLIGILSKSISFCIHSGESINELVKQSVRNYEGMNDKNGDDPHIIIQESSYIYENNINVNNNDNGIDFIRFTNNGLVYSLPKRITNSLVDYNGDETLFPLLIDSLMNKKVNIDKLKLGDQIDLLRMFEYCELPIPEELMKTYYQRDQNMKEYKEGDDVILYINDQKDDILRDYWKKNGLWNNIVNEYGDGYVDYDEKKNEMYMKMNYKYIDHIYEYIKTYHIYISEEETKTINRELLENEMYGLFGDTGRNSVKNGWNINVSFPHSYIVDQTTEVSLVNWLGTEKKWKLLFRASEHEYKASEFHKYCDNKGETVTIIKHIGKNNHINIFGGYTNQNWESGSGSYKSYSKEFLFTLSNEHGIPPTKYDYTDYNKKFGIRCLSSSGPTFGYGSMFKHVCDIYISNDCHNNNNSYCYASSYSEVNTPQKSSLFVNTSDHTDQCDIEFQVELLNFFTRTHFPKLSIYDLSKYYCCCPYDIQSQFARYLVPYSLLELIDILYIKHSNLYKNTFPINVESLETIFQVKKHHDITIQSYILIDKFDELMKIVLYSGLLIDYDVYFDFDDISKSLSDYSLIDLNLYPAKFIDIEANVTDYTILHRMECIYERINCDHLEAISIHLIDIIDEKINEYYNEYLSFLSTCNYTTVNKLTIDKHQSYFSSFETPNLQHTKETNDIFYKFFSLFTNNIQYIYIFHDTIQLPLWSNLQELYLYFNDTIESLSLTLFNELDKRQLNNLKIVSILCPCSISFDMTHIYTFIDSFKNASSFSFQNLNTFKISIKPMFGDNTIDIHLLESFPSFSFYLHKPITSIIMCKDICCFGNSIQSYENYIYNQLNSKYSKNIQYLEISSFDFNEEVTLLQSYNDTHLFYCEIIQCRLQDDDY